MWREGSKKVGGKPVCVICWLLLYIAIITCTTENDYQMFHIYARSRYMWLFMSCPSYFEVLFPCTCTTTVELAWSLASGVFIIFLLIISVGKSCRHWKFRPQFDPALIRAKGEDFRPDPSPLQVRNSWGNIVTKLARFARNLIARTRAALDEGNFPVI